MKNRFKVSYLQIAFRNLGRYKAKTIITTFAVALTVFLFVVLDSYILGTSQDIERYMLLYESGAARIYSKAYYEKKEYEPLYEGFSDYEKLVMDIEKTGYNAAPRARFSGTIVSKNEKLPITMLAVDPDKEKKVLYNHKFIKKGEFVQNGRFDIVIGQQLANHLGVTIGDNVQFMTQIEIKESSGKIRRIDQRINFRVGGIMNTPNVTVNTEMGFTALDVMQDEQGMMLNGQITEICLRDKQADEYDLVLETEKTTYIQDKLKSILPDSLMLAGWEEEAKDYINLAEITKMAMWLTLPVFLILGLLGIFNTMSIAVKQRYREIGMLRSMGMFNTEIIRLFLYEAGLIGIIGTVIGLALGLLITFYMVYVGIDLTSSIEVAKESARKAFIIHSAWSFNSYIVLSILIPLCCAISAFLPSIKALKTEISESLRMNII